MNGNRKNGRWGRRAALASAASLSAALVFTAFGSVTTLAASAQRGGTIVVALPNDTPINWLFPIVAQPYNFISNVQAATLMYKHLFHIGSNGTINYAKSVARQISWNKTGTVYTVDLNPKWHWSNGQPVTAQDVVFSWQVIKAASSPSAPAPWPFIGEGSGGIPTEVKSVVANNKYQVTITLNQPANQQWFVFHGLYDFTPLPLGWDKYPSDMTKELTYLGNNGDNPAFFRVVDGPFRLSKVVPNQSWTFVPNKHYNGHKPYVNQLIYAYETSDASSFTALEQGTVQVGTLAFSMYDSRKQLTNDRLVPTPVYDVSRTSMNYVEQPYASIFKQQAVREALEMAINQSQIIQSLYHGLAVPGVGPVPAYPSTYLSPLLRKPVYPYSLSKAKAVLEKAGWHEKHGVMTNSKGQKLEWTMIYPSGSLTSTESAEIMQHDWAQIGIRVTLQSMLPASILAVHHQYSKWQMLTGLEWNYSEPYPTGGGMYATNGGYNFFKYSNAEMNKLIAATHLPQPSTGAALHALFQYEIYNAQQLPTLYTPVPDQLNVYADSVHGIQASTNTITELTYPQYWWVSHS